MKHSKKTPLPKQAFQSQHLQVSQLFDSLANLALARSAIHDMPYLTAPQLIGALKANRIEHRSRDSLVAAARTSAVYNGASFPKNPLVIDAAVERFNQLIDYACERLPIITAQHGLYIQDPGSVLYGDCYTSLTPKGKASSSFNLKEEFETQLAAAQTTQQIPQPAPAVAPVTIPRRVARPNFRDL